MINKFCLFVEVVLVDILDGVIIMIGGFGIVGMLLEFIDGLIVYGVCELIIINNNVGNGEMGLVVLFKVCCVCKIVCLFFC